MPSLLIKPVANTNELEEVEVAAGSGGFGSQKIAIIEVEGMLVNARAGGGLIGLGAEENKLSLFTQQLARAEKDSSVKAVVLRINSPGGTVTCSDTMYQMAKRFRAKTKKPVIADTQEVAASGAYFIACSCDQIVAHPTSVIGSIGVIFETFEVSGAMQKLGVTSTAIKSGELKDMGSPFKPLDPKAKQVMQGMVDEYYARFVGVVRENRRISDEQQLARVTDGRVFSGLEAQKLGLVDSTGLLDDAIDVARRLGHASGARVIMYKRPYGYSGSIYADSSIQPPREPASPSWRPYSNRLPYWPTDTIPMRVTTTISFETRMLCALAGFAWPAPPSERGPHHERDSIFLCFLTNGLGYRWDYRDHCMETLSMTDNATLVEQLLHYRAPAIFQTARDAAARIAELARAQTTEEDAMSRGHDIGFNAGIKVAEDAGRAAVMAEREACIEIVNGMGEGCLHLHDIAAAIRARPTP
jgi:protease-4